MKSLISSGHKITTKVAADILSSGGNAYDAIIAAGFASSLSEATLTSLGGGGFLLAKPVDTPTKVFDFFVNMPGLDRKEQESFEFLEIEVVFSDSVQHFHAGLPSAAVPGNLKGYLEVHKELGSLPLADIVAPAIDLARRGVIVSDFQRHVMGLLEPILISTPESKKLFAPQGRLLNAGELFKNPEYADFLENITENAESFYSGSIAKQITKEMQENKGQISFNDLKNYKVNHKKPIKAFFRDYKFLSCPEPSLGGKLITNFLENYAEDATHNLSFATEEHLLKLISNMEKVENKRSIATKGTTHISVVDKDGNIASMTTSNGEGSGTIIKDTGIMLNNMLGEDDLFPQGHSSVKAGTRISSMMAPSLLTKDNKPVVILGSGGSKRIRSAISQVIVNLIDFEMPLDKAIDAPRLHLDDDLVQLEPNLIDPKKQQLCKYKLNHWSSKNMYFGGVHAIKLPDTAYADSRRDGANYSN